MDCRRSSKLTWLLIAIVGALTVCPVLMLVLGSFSEGLTAFGVFTTDKYVEAYTDPAFFEVMLNTSIFVLCSSTLSTVLAVFLAYLNTRTDIPFKGLFRIISIVPMMIPHLLFAVSWALLLNPSNGLINLGLKEAFGLDNAPLNIYSMPGMIFVEGLILTPLAFLIIAAALRSMDPALEESARTSGSPHLDVLRRVTLPLLRPALLAGGLVVFLYSWADFGVVSLLRVRTLTTIIYDYIQGTADWALPSALSILLTAITIRCARPRSLRLSAITLTMNPSCTWPR